MYTFKIGHIKVVIKEGDITEENVDAIVNPANSLMIMGGGVAGAIKRKGGNEIEREAMRKAPVPIGKAIVTTAGKLKAKYVIHSPTMERPAMRINVDNVRKAAMAALSLASNLDLKSIAFPALGSGVGGVSIRESIMTILSVIKLIEDKLKSINEVRLVAWSSKAYEEFVSTVKEFCESIK